MKIILTIILLFICVEAHAGYFIFHSGEEITGKRASCGAVCSNNPDALRVNETVYSLTTRTLHKVVGGVVVAKTQAEIDADIQARNDADALAKSKRELAVDLEISSIDINDISLPLLDAEIDTLGVSQNAKDFFKRLVRYISTIQFN